MKKVTNRFSKEFEDALEYCVTKNLYLGVGNPNAKILIVGKESSDDSLSIDEMGLKNTNSWNDIITNNRQTNDINHLEDNAFYPWKGQHFTIRREQKDGTYIGENGTSPTWYNYQILIDEIFKKKKKDKNNLIDFHELCFQSELNQLNSKSSDLIPKNDTRRMDSIKEREKLFSLPFFRNFKVVVIACGHYQRDFQFDIEKAFKVSWVGKTNTISSGNWYNIHFDDINNPKKIVIHTRQFSSGISGKLITELASIIAEFTNQNDINILNEK